MKAAQVLTSRYIKDGTSKLIEYTESTLNKKKMKKNIGQENIDFSPSIYNFIVLKPYRPNTSHITNHQIINNIEGKTRSSLLYKNQDNVYLKDIKDFQILYGKYLKFQQHNSGFSQQKQMLQNIKTRVSTHLFSSYLSNTQMDQCIQKVAAKVHQVKASANIITKQIFKQAQKTLLVHRSERQHYEYQAELQKQRKLSIRQLCVYKLEPYDQAQSEQMCSKIINLTIFRWFVLLLEAISLKDLLNTPTIIVQWENSLLEQEKEQLLAQQINGKLLFNVEQNIHNLIQTTKQIDFAKQFHLRQKKYGIHSYATNNQATKNDKPKNAKPAEKVSIVSFQDKSKANRQKKLGNQGYPQRSYSQIANRVNNLRQNYSSGKQVTQKLLIEPPNSIGSSYKQDQNIRQQSNSNYRFIQYKKPTPLKYEDSLSQYQFKQEPSQKQPLNNRLTLKNTVPALQQMKPTVSKVQVKFPIKIQRFQMNSWTDSFVCYKAEQINLKQLPLTFMKDRHKFGQNRVKIEYPCKPQANIVQVVCKSMQILNCFGAEVYCEEEASYKSVNEIDECQILAVSWIIEQPVREVIRYYGQYYGGCTTKK